jgi:polysaccharide pyruvyl transferase WcaK-like protein
VTLDGGTVPTGAEPARRERVLLIGNYGNGNIGDDAILTRMVPNAVGNARVTVLSRNPGKIAELVDGVTSVSMLSVRSLVAFSRADTVVIGGGGMFGRGLPPLVAILPFVLLVALAVGKQVELRSVGAYPEMPPLVGWALRRVVRRARHVSARDLASVNALGGPGVATLVRDPTWELEPAEPELVDAALGESGLAPDRPVIAIALKPCTRSEALEHCLSSLAEALNRWTDERPCELLVLSFSETSDHQFRNELTDLDVGIRLERMLTSGVHVRFVAPGLRPSVMLGVIGRSTAVIAMRLHAQIFATVSARPLFGLSFEQKCDEFLASVGVEPVRPDQVSPAELLRWLEQVEVVDPGEPALSPLGGSEAATPGRCPTHRR